MPSLVLVRHGDDPPDDRVVVFAVEAGFHPVIVKPFRGETLGEPGDDVAGTVVYGGPFNVFEEDRHPFLHDETRWIKSCMERGIPVLGICQGAQQVARILGAEVGPKPDEPHEFGYYRITPTAEAGDFLSGPMMVTESHFHTFDIPRGAVHLAGSEMFPNQAFRYGDRTFALQFHPEVTIEGFRRWQRAKGSVYGRNGVQPKDEQDRMMVAHDARQADWFYRFLSGLFGSAHAPVRARRQAEALPTG
jgi:GMP synthase (glutamine-hydrolysing)